MRSGWGFQVGMHSTEIIAQVLAGSSSSPLGFTACGLRHGTGYDDVHCKCCESSDLQACVILQGYAIHLHEHVADGSWYHAPFVPEATRCYGFA